MTLGDFLTVVAGECIALKNRPVDPIYYEGDKNAIRMNRAEDLDKEIYLIEARGKNKFTVIVR